MRRKKFSKVVKLIESWVMGFLKREKKKKNDRFFFAMISDITDLVFQKVWILFCYKRRNKKCKCINLQLY